MVGCGGISSFRSWFDGQEGGENPSVTPVVVCLLHLGLGDCNEERGIANGRIGGIGELGC
jgi:hypothetical protein